MDEYDERAEALMTIVKKLQAGLWDRHYGTKLSAEYARSVDKQFHYLLQDIPAACAALREQAKQIAQLKAQLALPEPDRGKTHYEGCWRDRGHHGCAIAEVERLMRELAVIGDMAVTDWNDPVVGVVNRAIGLQTPTSYVDWRKAELAQHGALRVENEQLKAKLSNRCDECGARTYSGPPGCPTCGAPNCCQQCCMADNLKAQLADAEKRGVERAYRSVCRDCACGFEVLQDGNDFYHQIGEIIGRCQATPIRAEIAKMEGKP